VAIWNLSPNLSHPAPFGRAKKRTSSAKFSSRAIVAFGVCLLALAPICPAVPAQPAAFRAAAKPMPQRASLPPRVAQAQRFLAQRGFVPGHRLAVRHATARVRTATAPAQTAATATWQPLGPIAVQTPDFGLVTGRVSALALDPSDATGNHLYLGTTGGGVWAAANAAGSSPSSILFTPLTDAVNALGGAIDASISIGALTVQPGGTGVILAGTGDPNDVLDSYYGAGILRSTDSGTTWTLIQSTQDEEDGLAAQDFSFVGEGFAGFAWSASNPQLVVAAVSQAYEGTLVDADRSGSSYEGLYYSADAGVTWLLATITDGSGQDVQGPLDIFAAPDGNAATAVVWNPLRRLFLAAVRFHGYYSSPDGITFTRMTAQPGSGLTALFCPTNLGSTGSIDCPIFRGALAVNPVTGDTFAWTVDLNNQDQGLWQDLCALSGASCGNAAITFARQLNTAVFESSTNEGAVTIPNGNYNLALAAVPSQQDTLLLAGGNDVWKCSLAAGCVWRNTTNSTTCMSAGVGEFQHALAWNAANPLEIFIANDSGLWRSEDAVGESGPSCSPSDATHFQNLNAGLGSLAEVVSLSPVLSTPYTIMAGLGVNGTAGVKNSAQTADWPQILSGYGGPVAIDAANQDNWYVNAQSGVSIYRCSQLAPCTPADFGSSPVVTDADVNLQPGIMPAPAPFLVDPLDSTQLLIATCQLWRGPADGSGWSSSDALTPILDSGATNAPCGGDALVRSMAAMKLPSGGEIIYLGTYGSANGGSNLPGHVLSVTNNPSSGAAPSWSDLTLNPVLNDANNLNSYGLDISSVFIDSHDTTGNTVYLTVAGIGSPSQQVEVVYRSTDGGAHWTDLTANLPDAPANSIAVDPQNANTVYLATDQGVYFTSQVANCTQPPYLCWSPFGTGLPDAPAVALSVAPASDSAQVLVAATYGRGIWQTPLFTASAPPTDALSPASLTFPSTAAGQPSTSQNVTLSNTGSVPLTSISVSATSGFQFTNGCTTLLGAGSQCTIAVKFVPTQPGAFTGTLTVADSLSTQTVALSGAGVAPAAFSIIPSSLNFTNQQPGVPSSPQALTITNSGGAPMANIGFQITGPAAASYSLGVTTCGVVLNNGAICTVQVIFTPSATGAIAALLTVTSSTAGVAAASIQLNGSGQLATGLGSSPSQLTFASVVGVGQSSSAQPLTITNFSSYSIANLTLSVAAPFTLSQNTCAASLAAGANCTAAVVFEPANPGPASGALTITSTSVASPVSVALSATGFDFSVTVTGLTSQTVSNGQTAVFPLVITPNGAQGAFTFGCGALPSNAVCTFNPATQTLPSGVQGNVNAEFSTGQSSSSAHAESPSGWRALPLLCGLFLLPLAFARRNKTFLCVLLAVLLAAGVSSCTSSSGGTGGSPPGGGSGSTPAGTYTIPVTVTSTGVSHSVNLTLTVD
jgi:hypothetical protein